MKAFTTITGILKKEPRVNKNGSIDILLKAQTCASKTTPKELVTINNETLYFVHVGQKSWNKISGHIKKDSVLKIKGDIEIKLNKNKIPFVNMNAFDLSIEGFQKKKNFVFEKFYEDNEIVYVSHSKIVIEEEVHKMTSEIRFGNLLKQIGKGKDFDRPIVVRKVSNNKYVLIMGFNACIVSKLLGLNKVPIIVRDMTHNEFMEKYNIPNY